MALASEPEPHSRNIGRLLVRSAAAPEYSMAVSSTNVCGRTPLLSGASGSGARSVRLSFTSGNAGGGATGSGVGAPAGAAGWRASSSPFSRKTWFSSSSTFFA